MERSLAGNIDDKAMTDEIADDEDEMVALVRLKSLSVDREVSKAREVSQPSTLKDSGQAGIADPLTEDTLSPLPNKNSTSKFEISDSVEEKRNSRARVTDAGRPVRYSLQEEPFHKSRVPRKSVLKKSEHPIRRAPSTYDSTHSPSISPQSSSPEVPRSPGQPDRSCCVVM